MNAQALIAESRRQRTGHTMPVIDLAYVQKSLTMLPGIVLNDGGNYERQPASMQAVVAPLQLSLHTSKTRGCATARSHEDGASEAASAASDPRRG